MKWKNEGVQKQWERYKFVILIVLAGVLLLLLPGKRETECRETGGAGPVSFPEGAEIQQEMETILEQISGVGQVKVMLTAETDGERKLAQDLEVSYSGSAAAPEEYRKTARPILTDRDASDRIVVTRSRAPTYRGALVVCEGGDRSDVRLTVTQAVSALTGLPADRITVAKWQ